MLKQPIYRVFLPLLIITMLAVGCGTESKNTSATPTPAPEPTTKVVKHLKGEAIISTNKDAKIAVLDYRLADSMLALGMKPYAMTSYLGETDLEYMDGKPLPGVINLGDDINLEAVLQADPDFIIARQGNAKVYDDLVKIAPTIILEESDDWRADLRKFAEILDRTAEADKWLKQYTVEAEEAKKKVVAQVGAGKTAVIIRATPKDYRIYGDDQQLGSIIYGDLGFTASDKVKEIKKQQSISLEVLPEFDADYIFVQIGMPVKGGDKDAEKKFAEMQESSLFKNMSAVKNNRVYIMPYWTLRDFPIINQKTVELVTTKLLSK
ncbi:MAG TPA: ABC transporter substrate-binding protein [Paenibacillus sp.]|jgi:iron complex transport system substrate-binding protein